MTDLVTSAQMRAIETAAIESGAVTGATLMERAGAGVVVAILAEWPMLERGARALVLCGPGNNGGDGYVIARRLAARGWPVTVLALGDPARLPPDAAAMARAWSGPVQPYGTKALAAAAPPGPPLVIVDALFGIGLSRPLGADVLTPWEGFVATLPAGVVWVAVDVPSGLSDDQPTGRSLADSLPPDIERLTVTFHAAKPAHAALLAAGERVRIADIGLHP